VALAAPLRVTVAPLPLAAGLMVPETLNSAVGWVELFESELLEMPMQPAVKSVQAYTNKNPTVGLRLRCLISHHHRVVLRDVLNRLNQGKGGITREQVNRYPKNESSATTGHGPGKAFSSGKLGE